MKQFTLNKYERIKRRKTFEALTSKGKYIVTPSIRLVYLISPLERNNSIQAGFSVSKKNFKRAVVRNYIKRRIRESYRKGKIAVQQTLNSKNLQADLLFIFISKEIQTYMQINKEILIVLQQFLNSVEKHV